VFHWPPHPKTALKARGRTPHMQKGLGELVAEDGRCCMRARCVVIEHLGDRRKAKPRVVDRGRISTGICRREERPAALIYTGAAQGIWHKTWPDVK
jgi:hypothetical protein